MSQNFTDIRPEIDINYIQNETRSNNPIVVASPLYSQLFEEVQQQIYASGFIPSEVILVTPGPDFSINMIGNNKGSFWFQE